MCFYTAQGGISSQSAQKYGATEKPSVYCLFRSGTALESFFPFLISFFSVHSAVLKRHFRYVALSVM